MIEVLLTMWQLDGTLTLSRTPECEYLARYENRLAAGPGDEVYQIDGATVAIVKGAGTDPERLTVRANGMDYAATVPENTTGEICVPVYLGF